MDRINFNSLENKWQNNWKNKKLHRNKKDKKLTFYLCENFSCKQPTTNIKTILNYLNEETPF